MTTLNTYCSNDPGESVNLVTTHFNPGDHHLLRDTYRKWKPTLGGLSKHLKTYEIVFDGRYDIEEAIKIQGTVRNLMWQKEALLNKALQDTPDSTEFFVWLDHDVVFQDPDWLSKAIEILRSGEVDAVHCLNYATMLNRDLSVLNPKHWTPGFAWCSTTKYMKEQNGFSHYAIVGGGDSLWLHEKTERLYQPMLTFKETRAPRWTSLNSRIFHLYHGTLKNRMYWGRQKILEKHNYQKEDVRLNKDGILEWATNKTGMHNEIKQFFQQRGG